MKLSVVAIAVFLFFGTWPIDGVVGAEKIYKIVDKDGNVSFTDQPPKADEAAETVEMDILNSFDTDEPSAPTEEDRSLWIVDESTDPEAGEGAEALEYTSIRVASPAHDSTVRDNAGNLSVAAEILPGLYDGHRLRLLLDGVPQATSRQLSFELTNVDRGTHNLMFEVIDANDVVVATSPVSLVHLQRYSVLGPAARRRSQGN